MPKKSYFEKHQTLIVGIAIIAVIYYMASNGLINFGGFSLVQQAPLAPLAPQTQYYAYNVQANIVPNPVCVNNNITATITSNIPNGVCSIFVNPGTGFVLLANVNLDASGGYSVTQRMNTIGTAVFRTICCDTQGNCRISNDVPLVVTNAIPPCLPGPAGPDSDGDGFSDDEEIAADTNPFDPNDYPGSNGVGDNGGVNCDTFCVDLGHASGRGPVDSPGHCIYPEVYVNPCCCTPTVEPETILTSQECQEQCIAAGRPAGYLKTGVCDFPQQLKITGTNCCCHLTNVMCQEKAVALGYVTGYWFGYSTDYYCGVWAQSKCSDFGLDIVGHLYDSGVLCCYWSCGGVA